VGIHAESMPHPEVVTPRASSTGSKAKSHQRHGSLTKGVLGCCVISVADLIHAKV